jgi:signal transduction histidine kinase
MLATIAVKYSLKEKGLDPAAIPELVDAAFASLLRGAAASAAEAPAAAAPARMILTQKDTDQAATLQAGPEAGLVSEELLQRSLRTNVELAEALADLVREVGTGLSSILSHAELLQVYREEAREKRQAAILAIQAEAARLRRIMQDLGEAGSAARASAPAPPAPPASAPAVPSAAVATNPRGTPGLRPPAGPTLDQALQEGVAQMQATLEARTLRVALEPSATPIALRIPPAAIGRAVAALLHALAALSPAGGVIRLRGERKPVLLRGRDGSEQRRDFFMVACAHAGVLNSEQQQRVLQGSDPGPFGAACRVVRELGGFVRFAPLSGGGLETRFFVPAA